MKVVGFHSMGVSHTVVQMIFGIGGVYMTNVSPKVSCHLPQVQQSSSTRRKIEGFNWRMLHDICSSSGILPPTTGTSTFNVPLLRTQRPKTRKRKSSGV